MSWLAKLTGGGGRAKASTQSPSPAGRNDRPSEMAGIKVAIDRHIYSVADMSIRTFLIQPYDGDLIPKQKFGFKFLLDKSGESNPVTIFCQGYVRSVDENGMLAIFRQPQPVFQQMLINHILQVKGVKGR